MDVKSDQRPSQSEVERTEHFDTNKPGADIAHIKEPGQVAFFADFAGRDAEWVAFQNKKLVRRIDMRLLPLLIALYMLNFLDRSNLAQARQGTLEVDLGMEGTDFNLATSIFFVWNSVRYCLDSTSANCRYRLDTLSCSFQAI